MAALISFAGTPWAPSITTRSIVILRPSAILNDHRHVAIGQLLGLGCHHDLEVAFLLVRLLELLGGAVDLDGIVDTAQLQVDLLGQCGGVELLVAAEDDVAHERPLDHDEGDLHAALEVLDLELHVVEEAERKDGANVLSEAGGLKRRAGLGADAAQDDRFLHPPIPLHHDVFDDRRGSRRRRGWWYWRLRRRHARRQWQKGKKMERNALPALTKWADPCARALRTADQCSANASGGSAVSIARKTKFSPSASTSILAPSPNCPRTIASASGSSTCFWSVRRS